MFFDTWLIRLAGMKLQASNRGSAVDVMPQFANAKGTRPVPVDVPVVGS